MYTGLVNGGSVYIVPWDKRGNPIEIAKIMEEQMITYKKATPSEYSLWMQYGGDTLRRAHDWRFAFGGGETLTTAVTQQFADLELPRLRLFNSYGPTEISISSTKMEIPYQNKAAMDQFSRIPCGYALPNHHKYIVDNNLKPVPIGMPGERMIGAAGVSRGYLNNKGLTDRQFISSPFATSADIAKGWTRIYRTGDICHLNQDGAMVFHNRISGDTQIKIRGIRIEITDIEASMLLTAEGNLQDVVVSLREGDPDYLVAHVVFNASCKISDKVTYLEQLLGKLPLPQYMLPTKAIPIDALPLTNHSKIDRKAAKVLPIPVSTSKHQDNSEMTETMAQLKLLWEEVLGKSTVDLDITPTTTFSSLAATPSSSFASRRKFARSSMWCYHSLIFSAPRH